MAPAKLRATRTRKGQSKKGKDDKEKKPDKFFLCYSEELAVTKRQGTKRNTLRKPEVNAKPDQHDQLYPTPPPKLVLLGQKRKEKNGIKEEASQSNPEKSDPD